MKNVFDLYERAKLGLNFLNNNVDHNRGCLPYFITDFKHDPAEARHDWPDFGDLTSRYVESFILTRKMLGIALPGTVELALQKLLLSYFNEEDGLSYRPMPDKPYYSTIFKCDYNAHVAEGFDQARVLWALLEWHEESNDPLILTRIFELVNGLNRVLIKKDDYGYYDRSTIEPDTVVDPNSCPMPNQYYFCGTQIHPLIEVYRRLGYKKAGEMARSIANYIVYHSDYFFPDGRWNCQKGDNWSTEINGHTHSRFATIAGVVIVAILDNDHELILKMKNCYDWFVKHHCSSFGWSPEFLGRFGDENEGCETCAIMDQIHCCLAFCEAGYTEYYEQIEKIARNQLLENQLVDTAIVRNTIERSDTEFSSFHDVGKMVLGGFAGWAGPNDFIGNCDNNYCLMNCCGPAGLHAIYDTWDNIYKIDDDNIYVNIFFDKRDDNIALSHAQPYQGMMTIVPQKKCRLHLLSRTWFDFKNIQICIDGKIRNIERKDPYIYIGTVLSGQKVEIRYPLENTQETLHVNGRNYIVNWRGDTVIGIKPSGSIKPFYVGRMP